MELHLKEVEELNRQFRRASFDRRNKEDAAGRAARRSESHDEGPDPSRESNCNLRSKVAADNKDQDNYDLKGIQRWDSGMGAMVMYGCANNTVHAYQAISAEAFLDSGANVSIFTLDNEPHMTDKVASKLSVTGFSGKDLEGKSDGCKSVVCQC